MASAAAPRGMRHGGPAAHSGTGRGGERLTFTLTVSVEDAVLAAWIMAKAKRKAIGRPGLLPHTVSLDSVDGEDSPDLERVRRYLEQVVSQAVVRDWHQLERSDHPALPAALPV